nr:CFI-box-CTERM domain-containing protein [Marinobacter nauticus]
MKYAGAKPSQRALAAQDRGNLKHEQFNRQISTDKRCYVASYLYGVEDPRTETLRQFRDNTLQCSPGGRILIAFYYWLSPVVIKFSKRASWIDWLLRRIVDRLVLRSEQRGKNHDS